MMLYADKPIPLYKQLYHQLHEQIENGDYQVGEKLPSVRELAADCGISRLTARKAIGLLEQDGYVYVQHGKGIFVLPVNESIQPITRKSLAVLIGTATDVTPAQRITGVNIVVADEALAKKLKIRSGDKVIRLEKVRFADDIPVSFDVSWLPADLCAVETYEVSDDPAEIAE